MHCREPKRGEKDVGGRLEIGNQCCSLEKREGEGNTWTVQMGKGRPTEGREAPRAACSGGGDAPVQLSLNPSPDDASSG